MSFFVPISLLWLENEKTRMSILLPKYLEKVDLIELLQ